MTLPASLSWVEVDMPKIVALKEALLPRRAQEALRTMFGYALLVRA